MADSGALKVDSQNHLLLDQPLLRLPHELLRANFRTTHFEIERDGTWVKDRLKEAAKASLSGGSSRETVLKSLDQTIARMQSVKTRMTQHADEEARLYRQTDARIRHLGELATMQTVEDVKYENWSRTRLDRLLIDYLLRHGYNETAQALADAKDIRDLVDIDTFVQMSRIRQRLREGSVTEALAWCAENKKELRKNESNLEFMLRFQQYIELIRSGDTAKAVEAIGHARKYLAPFEKTYPKEMLQAGGLLAFSSDVPNPAYGHLLSPSRWNVLAELFTETHNNLLGLPTFPLLHTALSSGLSALKTPACHSTQPSSSAAPNHSVSLAGSSVCPICSKELKELARNVPYAHHSKSYVEPDLVVLPNDRVHSRSRLEEYAVKAGLWPENVKDLRTGDVFPASTMKKIYVT